jgi:hypothetical protein
METQTDNVTETRKKRPQEAKIGRVKYTLQLIKEVQQDTRDLKLMVRTIFAGLKGLFHFQKPLIEKICCSDEVDKEILQLLLEAGGSGMLPKDLATRLEDYSVKRHQVSRRIVRMNKRLQKEIGETLVEQRGWHWALTGFALEIWGEENGRAEHTDQA